MVPVKLKSVNQKDVEYPFTNKPERLFSLLSIVDFASVCPVVFEMLERLKQIYGFKRRQRY
jgi:uncharacterized protein